jgi:hypothetical protein
MHGCCDRCDPRLRAERPLAGLAMLTGRRARTSARARLLTLPALVVCLGGCLSDPWAATIPPDVPVFAPTVVGVIERYEPPTTAGHGTFLLVDGTRVEYTKATRTLFLAGNSPGDLLAAGSDSVGPWTAYASHVAGSTPDCFRASGIAFDDGDGVVFEGYRFVKARGFSAHQSATRGHRYPVGDPCFDVRFQVLAVGRP